MDFFEAQARAKKRSARLVLLFAFAVAGTITAAYFASVFGISALNHQQNRARYDRYSYVESSSSTPLWQPKILFAVTLGTLLVVGGASLFKWHQYSSGGAAVAESVGGRPIESNTTDLSERRLLNVVEEMAIASGVPVPTVYVLDDEPAINAFAAGLTTSDAVIAVTRGTLEKLNRDELQGVIGHEFSHVLNGDMRLNLRLTALLFGILVLGLAGRGLLWSLRGARFSSRGNKNSGNFVLVLLAVGVALMVIGYVGYFFGRLIQAAVSRQREFLADASAVQFTRNPTGISSALKKIGGYALGSRLQTSRAAAIGHFFFAQSFRSGITGLWATHPPLDERIRAIDPNFDGKMFEAPSVVDVSSETFLTAGFAPPPVAQKPINQSVAFDAHTTIGSAGTLTPEQVSNAESLLANVPGDLRTAARSSQQAAVVLYGLLLSEKPSVRDKQLSLIERFANPSARAAVENLSSAFSSLGPEHKLPLVQLTLPALRTMSKSDVAPMLATLDELVHADGQVSPFEFSLQKLISRTLVLGQSPKTAVTQYYSFQALAPEIGLILSTLAQASTKDSAEAQRAFQDGATQLKLLDHQLSFTSTSLDFAGLDAALDKLALASGPIKQRTLIAAAHVVSSNGVVLIEEAELLRAIAAALDIPLPPLNALSN